LIFLSRCHTSEPKYQTQSADLRLTRSNNLEGRLLRRSSLTFVVAVVVVVVVVAVVVVLRFILTTDFLGPATRLSLTSRFMTSLMTE